MVGPPGNAREKQLQAARVTRLNAGPYTRLRLARITQASNLNLLKNIAQNFGVGPKPYFVLLLLLFLLTIVTWKLSNLIKR